jgi:hypothetical protein
MVCTELHTTAGAGPKFAARSLMFFNSDEGDSFTGGSGEGKSRVLFDHASTQAYFGARAFWRRRLAVVNSDETAVGDWQIKRGQRGIVEIVFGVTMIDSD